MYSRSHCGVNAQEVLAASDWEQQVQHGSHSEHGQTFEAVKHIPFPTGNHSLSLQVNNCLPTKNYNFKKMELGLIIICE